LFEVEAKTEQTLSDKGASFIVVGTTTNQSLFSEKSAYALPELSEQGHLVKSIDVDGNSGLLIAGGSPVATLWAVYEFGYQNGVRYLLQSDIYPETPKEFTLTGYDVKLEPDLQTRGFRLGGTYPDSFISWNAAQCKSLIAQLAKLKFTHIEVRVEPWHPFIHYEIEGVAKQTGLLWKADTFPIDPSHPGSTAFKGADQLQNTDFAGLETYKERLAAGQQYLKTLITAAHEAGMTIGVTLDPLESTPEFREVLEGSFVSNGPPLTTGFPYELRLNHDGYPWYKPDFEKLARTQLQAYADTYPELDVLTVQLPETFVNPAEVKRALKELQAYTDDLDDIPVAEIVKPISTRAQQDASKLPGDTLLAIAFYNRLFRTGPLAEFKEFPRLQFAGIRPVWGPYVADLLPKSNSAVVAEASPWTGSNQPEELTAPAAPALLECSLHLNNLSVIAMSTTRWLAEEVKAMEKGTWKGVVLDMGTPAEHVPTAHFLSRVAFDAAVTPEEAHEAYFSTVTQNSSSTDRMWLAFGHMEAGTKLLEQQASGFVSPSSGRDMLTAPFKSQWDLPGEWEEIKEQFTASMTELYRSHDQVKTPGRKELYYYAKRSEAVLSYLTCVEELHAAAEAEKEEDLELTSEHLYTALEALYDAIDTLNDVARNPSDLGTIALLNQYAYAPLLEEVERIEAALEEAE
ncbi:MAG: hypothetical protein CMJ46_04440, partial [Planctomyces sp.]|nr:hypothetical protein [Planctomyces sp.]